ncbi:uncharacterized protein LOC132626950 [Lycium barbarum]|uniref:uncharacterized protein LOC132626950 n=1 Tax=Lycium barbarum TaxID=112863 RepID=UPI00293F201B|nr:uncharacterized protein LOC132626950 [Lycium barbarum]
MPSDEMMVVVECGKSTGEFHAQNILCQFPFSLGANLFIVTVHGTAIDLCVWDLGISFKSKALVGCTVNMEPLLLLGSTETFFLIAYANSMTQVWDPGWQECMRSSILLSVFELAVAIGLIFNCCYTHLIMNTQTKEWEKNFRGLFVFPFQCMSLALNVISKCRRKTHPAIRLDRLVQSLWSLTYFPACLAERVSSPPVHNNYWTCYFMRTSTDFLAGTLAITP